MIEWNKNLELVLADVDETIADVYMAATPEMIKEIGKVLEQGIVVFLITGSSINSVRWRIIDHIKPELRKQILVSHCSGAEVLGFDEQGELKAKPYYSLYENALTDAQKKEWRDIVKQLVNEFKLEIHPTMPVKEFKVKLTITPWQ